MSRPILIKLGIAVLIGGIIGLEREIQYKAAGFRTIILITIGPTLYTLFSISIAVPTDSLTRIASNIVTGVGFLRAGIILRDSGRIDLPCRRHRRDWGSRRVTTWALSKLDNSNYSNTCCIYQTCENLGCLHTGAEPSIIP